MRRDQLRADRARQCKLKRSDLAALDRGCQRAGAKSALIALLEQWIKALPELGQLRLRALTAEQVAAKLVFELLDSPSQGRLGHIAALRRFREIQLADRRQEISD